MRCGGYRRKSAWTSSKASSISWRRRFRLNRKRAWLTPSPRRTRATWWTGWPRSRNCAGEFATKGERAPLSESSNHEAPDHVRPPFRDARRWRCRAHSRAGSDGRRCSRAGGRHHDGPPLRGPGERVQTARAEVSPHRVRAREPRVLQVIAQGGGTEPGEADERAARSRDTRERPRRDRGSAFHRWDDVVSRRPDGGAKQALHARSR